MARVTEVAPYGLAKKAGIRVGEEVCVFGDHPFVDILDYVYADGLDEVELLVRAKNGKMRSVWIEKEHPSDTMGLSFDESVEIDSPALCKNNCIFCFVNQMPKGLRATLAVKDDDYRYSFLNGTYITCTNLTKADIQKILDYHLSPLYVSVHATDHATRLELLGVKKAPNQMEMLTRFTQNGIRLHAQIVVVPGRNDEEVLKQSLADLHQLGENLLSVAVVPVGLTKHREGLPRLRVFNKHEAQAVVDIVEAFHDQVGGFCYCSDEFYNLAELPTKDYDYYDGFPQIENGVGLVTKFLTEIEDALLDAPKKVKRKVLAITGVDGAKVLTQAKALLIAKWKHVTLDIVPIKNHFFGETVTVAGLVTAGDIMEQTKDIPFSSYDMVLIPMVMLKEFDTVFLDNVSLEELEQQLQTKITLSPNDGAAFVDILAFGDEENQ